MNPEPNTKDYEELEKKYKNNIHEISKKFETNDWMDYSKYNIELTGWETMTVYHLLRDALNRKFL